MKSREELVQRALQELGVAGSGQAASAEDATFIDNQVDPMFDNLAQREVWQWGDPDQIDDNAFTPLAKWLANANGRPFGVAFDQGLQNILDQQLRELKPIFLSGQPQSVEYF